jgi:uracil-DNA glycosylase
VKVKIEASWQAILNAEFEKPYFINLTDFVREEYQRNRIYPAGSRIFAAFDSCPVNGVKVVVLGQDPYHGPGQANGLAFSVNDGIRVPPSLLNIYKELKTDLGIELSKNGNLTHWAEQGVLLLNSTLTVERGKAGSHQGKGWEEFTDATVQLLSRKLDNLVFILWGAYAQRKGSVIDRSRHLVIESPHPSPFSAARGFLAADHFHGPMNTWLIAEFLQLFGKLNSN